MFYDKVPINWQRDGLRLIARKIMRGLAAIPPVVWGMEKTTRLLEAKFPARSQKLRHALYRWIQGAYMYRGYYEGLYEYY